MFPYLAKNLDIYLPALYFQYKIHWLQVTFFGNIN